MNAGFDEVVREPLKIKLKSENIEYLKTKNLI